MKKILCIILALAACFTLLSACGKKEQPSGPSASSPSELPAPETDLPDESEPKIISGIIDMTEDYTMVITIPDVSPESRIGRSSEPEFVGVGSYNDKGTARLAEEYYLRFSALGLPGQPWEYLGATVDVEVSGSSPKLLNTIEKCTYIVPADSITFPDNRTVLLPNGVSFEIEKLSLGGLYREHLINEGGRAVPVWKSKDVIKDANAAFWNEPADYYLFSKIELYVQNVVVPIPASELPSGFVK